MEKKIFTLNREINFRKLWLILEHFSEEVLFLALLHKNNNAPR